MLRIDYTDCYNCSCYYPLRSCSNQNIGPSFLPSRLHLSELQAVRLGYDRHRHGLGYSYPCGMSVPISLTYLRGVVLLSFDNSD